MKTAAETYEYLRNAHQPVSTTEARLNQKREEAIAYLRSRGKYILDKGTPPPSWRGVLK